MATKSEKRPPLAWGGEQARRERFPKSGQALGRLAQGEGGVTMRPGDKWIGCIERDRARAIEWARTARGTYRCPVYVHKRTVRADGVALVVWVAVVWPREP